MAKKTKRISKKKANGASKAKASAVETKAAEIIEEPSEEKVEQKAEQSEKSDKSSGLKIGRGGVLRNRLGVARESDMLMMMSHYNGRPYKWQMLPAAFFTAFIIIIVRMYSYTRGTDFYWASESSSSDFFSYYKLIFIGICASLAVVILLFRLVSQTLVVYKSKYYIPAGIYIVFTLLSLIFSKYKEYAWLGANDRFEGTLALLCYFVMVFYIINSINDKKIFKWILYPVCASMIILSLLGLSQALDHDFFRTAFGQKLIVPNFLTENGTVWSMIDAAAQQGEQLLKFTFQNKEIYQTVYNTNYVSYYLTLIVPLFAMLFLRETKVSKKVFWGIMLALAVFNMLGASSSGGLIGIFVAFVMIFPLFGKLLIKWWKSVLVMVAIIVIAAVPVAHQWIPDVAAGFGLKNPYEKSKKAEEKKKKKEKETLAQTNSQAAAELEQEAATEARKRPETSKNKIDFIDTDKRTVYFSVDGKKISAKASKDGKSIEIFDAKDKKIKYTQAEEGGITLDSQDYPALSIAYTKNTEEGGDNKYYLIIGIAGEARQWPLRFSKGKFLYRNDLGKFVDLDNIPSFGFKGRENFGTGRGYIWSRAIPVIKNTIFIGTGADTAGLVYPHKDYVGKYNVFWNVNAIVDKPHNFYIATAINTGVISLLALLALYLMYIVSSFRLFKAINKKSEYLYDETYVRMGAGIFVGVTAFVCSSIVDDSTVSVMPLFYGLLATGIAINRIIMHEVTVEKWVRAVAPIEEVVSVDEVKEVKEVEQPSKIEKVLEKIETTEGEDLVVDSTVEVDASVDVATEDKAQG